MSDIAITATPEASAAQPTAVPSAPVAPVIPVAHAAAPAVVAPAAIPAPVAPAVVMTDVEPEPGKEPGWLAKRLERERIATLRKLGVEGEDDAKKAIAEHKARAEADKSALQKALEQAARADGLEAKNKALLGTVSIMATAQLAALTPEQRAAVAALAGEDPAAQITAIEAMRPSWVAAANAATAAAKAHAQAAQAAAVASAAAVAAAPPVTAPAVATPAPLAAPANTAPVAPAPPPVVPPQKSPLAVYNDLKTSGNRMAAAAYRLQHDVAITAEEKSRS